jgi:phosphorylcholine metabolism protein LicD
LFSCVSQGFAHNPKLAFRHVWKINPFARDSWQRFSLVLHGGEFLTDFYAASSELDIEPFLMWGTLLGCVRDGKFVKGDRDIDVGILAGDWAKKDRLVSGMLRRGYVVDLDCTYKLKFRRADKTLSMDVDVFYPWNGQMICSRIVSNGDLVGAVFPRSAFDRFRETSFLNGIRVRIPDLPEVVLATIYGDWKTPASKYKSGSDLLNPLTIAAGQPFPDFPGS